MHILEIPSFFTPYGGEFCLEQAKALKALGHEVRILSNVQLGVTIKGKDYWVLPFSRYEHQRDGSRCVSRINGLAQTGALQCGAMGQHRGVDVPGLYPEVRQT